MKLHPAAEPLGAIYALEREPSTVAAAGVVGETTCVVAQVYISTKPASPRRTWIASLALFLAAGTLAWVMTAQRADGMILPRIEPPGWAISFHPPAAFRQGFAGLTSVGPAYQFISRPRDHASMALIVTRVQRDPSDDALVIAERSFRSFLEPLVGWDPAGVLADFGKTLGPLAAVEIWDPGVPGLVVRAAVVDDDAYAISLQVQDGKIEPAMYALFEEACVSVHYLPMQLSDR